MATCKECIHYDVCYHIEHYGRHMETEESCGGFKNKADFVEVVRCKDCINFKEKRLGEFGTTVGICQKDAMWCEEPIEVLSVDFCSGGERKTVTDTNVGGK